MLKAPYLFTEATNMYPYLCTANMFSPLRKMSDNAMLAAIAKSAGKRPVAELQIVGVANLSPSDIGKGVRVKVYRKWTLTPTRGARQPTFSCILLDQQGGAIQANAEGRERIRFDNILRVNEAYTITGFGLLDTKPWMQTLPNPFTLILGRATDVQAFSGNGFPPHHFNFAAYDELPLRADRNDVILTDYIGCVLNVGGVQEPRNPSQKPVVWRDIIIRNLEGDTVRFTLWNEKARAFDTDAYEKEPKPTVMAVSSCWVKAYGGLQLSSTPATCYYFNPAIPETDYILSMYNELVAPPVIQNVQIQRYNNIEQEKSRNRVTVDQLLREDPRNQTSVRFTVIARVLETVTGRPWFFRRCHDCRHKIRNQRPHAHCQAPNPGEPDDYSYSFRILISDDTGTLTLTCFSNEAHSMVAECNKVVSEQGFTDPYTLPPILTALEGTSHLFQLHYSTDSTIENRVYILDTVMETGPHLVIQPHENAPTDLPVPEPQNEILLTGPETDTQTGSHSPAAAEGASSTAPTEPLVPAKVPTNDVQQEATTPMSTPSTGAISEASTPVTIGITAAAHKQPEKFEGTKTSVRRQLLRNDTQEGTSAAAKKTKQGE